MSIATLIVLLCILGLSFLSSLIGLIFSPKMQDAETTSDRLLVILILGAFFSNIFGASLGAHIIVSYLV